MDEARRCFLSTVAGSTSEQLSEKKRLKRLRENTEHMRLPEYDTNGYHRPQQQKAGEYKTDKIQRCFEVPYIFFLCCM